ncbi:LuxR C-terminal-related transcriptional regulator [Pseudomonas sp. H9]|uniref:LuxR C-terminal-related transcriptional regulator n=1 Tax=Pseudomonas sp. H9 TaxID=483968 RepID=UPI0010578025|nr:LuxR C-terminal-related transcriptional regulator [Pseudomonas sp. H9]TDF83808.1 LuxR family transcriptional regulator [Pseudomonas sp. H9]
MPTPSPSGLHLPANRALQVIPDTKVIPPRGARYLMPRTALMARLMEARRQRCVVIQGPAGSGKTSTMLAWRRELMGINFDVAWLSVINEDNDPIRLAHCLRAALAEVDEEMTRDAAVLLGRDTDELALEHWVIVLLQDIAKRERELMLMIDDIHQLEDPLIFQTLGWLLDYAPPNLHLALGSRTSLPPSLPLARLRSQGRLDELDLRDLRFSAEESERFLREQLGEVHKRDAETLHELTDGWVAGLQLFAIDIKSRRGATFSHRQVRDASAFAQFFEQEVLNHLPADDLELLGRASICNRFCAALCARLMGKPNALAWMMNHLSRLDSENLFITQIKSHDREIWYRLHPLLREVLRARLADRSQEQLQQLHACARDWFFDQGYVDEAVRHAVLAGDAQAAADIVEACAHDLMSRGTLSHLPNLLRKLPLEQIQERFGLQLAMLQLQLYAQNFAEAQKIIEHLLPQQERLSVGEQQTLLISRGTLAMQLDSSEDTWALAPAIEALPETADDFVLTGRATVLGWLYSFSGEFERARGLIQQNDRLATSPRRTLLGRCIFALGLAIEGRHSEAEHILRIALGEAQQIGDSAIPSALAISAVLSSTLYEQGNIKEACHHLEQHLAVLERVALPGVVMTTLLTLANSHWLSDRRLEAQASIDRLEEHAQRFKLDRLMATALFTRLRWAVQKNQSVQAESLMAQLNDLAARHAGIDRGVPQMIQIIAKRGQIELHLFRQEFSQAVSLLLPLVNLAETKRRWPLATYLRLQLAIAEEGCGHIALARKQLIEALRQGHRLGLTRSLLDASPQIPGVLQAMLDKDVLDPVLAFYAQRLLSAATPVQAPTRKSSARIEALSDRESEVLHLMAQAMTNKKIARILNVSPETVKWHLKNVFGKLGVTGRDEAIARWRDQTIGKYDDGQG